MADDLHLPEDLNISKHFSFYGTGGSPGIDWQALYDPCNNGILKACLRQATKESLQNLEIVDIEQCLARLEQGNLIKKVNERYHLAFPAIVGKKRDELQKIVENSAAYLLPTAEKMAKEVFPTLKGHEEMLYHVLWSVIMDGPVAWQAAAETLKQQVKDGNTSFNNKSWLVYPRHRFNCGTNSYNISCGQLRITHSPNMFQAIRSSISQRQIDPIQYKDEFLQFIKQAAETQRQGRLAISENAKKELYKHGLVDHQGNPKIFTIELDPNNLEVPRLYVKISQQFGKKVISSTNITQIANSLDVEAGIAFLVAYHEISYEVLQRLAEKKALDIPAIVTESNDISEIYRLVSLTIMPEGVNLQQLEQLSRTAEDTIKDDRGKTSNDSKAK